MKSNSFWRILLGAFVGAFGYTWLAGYLDEAYRPFSSDLPAWIIYAFPTGAILGGVSAHALTSELNEKYLQGAVACLATAALIAFCYVGMLRHTLSLYPLDYALSESGPALGWSALLFVYGAFLAIKHCYRNS